MAEPASGSAHPSPPAAEIEALSAGEYIVRGTSIHVRASKVDYVHIYYVCPFCWSAHKKNGQPYARARRREHFHGSDGDLRPRREHRADHCVVKRYPPHLTGGVFIHITAKTLGCVVPE